MSVFDQAELRHYNRVQAWLSILLLDFRAARRYLHRNKQIHRHERIEERTDDVN